MKLLILASRFPYPLEKGDKLRLFHQITYLSRQHEIILCCLNEGKPKPEDFQKVRTLGILRHFRDKFRPDLDGPIDELCKCMKWKERRDDIQAQLQLATTDGDDITATTAESTLLSLTSLHLD